MLSNKQRKPTESELEILQVIWTYGPSTVRFINEKLNARKKVGYTTTLKIMQIMYEKAMLIRDEHSRTHIYSANLDKEETQNLLLNRFLQNTFGGSASKMVMQALGNYEASAEELEEIKKLIENLKKDIHGTHR